jgi:peptidoglycan/LPS O-acetylase OafA/YrhL
MKLSSIQILRGFAAMLVVFYHIRALEISTFADPSIEKDALIQGFVSNGYGGVDLFFVISGFIMVHVTGSDPTGPRTSLDFLFARMARIYPLWWICAGTMTLLLALYAILLGPAGPNGSFVPHAEATPGFFLKSFFLLPQATHPVLGVGWTLTHEVYFYFVFAILLLLPRNYWPFLLLLWAIGVVVGSVFAPSSGIAQNFAQLIVYPMTVEFILGAVVGIFVGAGVSWRAGMLLLMGTLAFMASLNFQGEEDNELLQWARVLLFGVPGALIVYAAATLEQTRRTAWFLPAAVGLAVSALVSLYFGVYSESTLEYRLTTSFAVVIAGAAASLAVLLAGLAAGRMAPEHLFAMAPGLKRAFDWSSKSGDWSYSLYLVHPIVIAPIKVLFLQLSAIGATAGFFQLSTPGGLDNILFVLLTSVAAVVASLLIHKTCERSINRVAQRLRQRLFSGLSRQPSSASAAQA